jgi:hypothetical protein
MIDALKILWGSTGGKISAILFVVVLAASTSFAYVKGSTSGHDSGFTAGQKSRDTEVKGLSDKVTALTSEINTKRQATNDKIDKVENNAANDAVATQKQLTKQIRERDAIIAAYEKNTPTEVKESCGLSIETVRAINQLIDNANETPVPDTPTAGAPANGSPDSSDPGRPTTPSQPTPQGALNDSPTNTQVPDASATGAADGEGGAVPEQGGTYAYLV